jgi:hypothetical protein
MAVTKQTYTATPTWTVLDAANLLQDAFIDAGLMTAWHDSFTSGSVENRVLEITYDGSKTYGKCYYWFVLTSNEIRVSVASGWDAATDIPTGTQYQDFYSTTTSSAANHALVLGSLATGTQLDLLRYTSAVNTDYSWFVLRNGATSNSFFIAPGSSTLVPWLDLNKFLFHHFVRPDFTFSAAGATDVAGIRFLDTYRLRRSYRDGQGLRAVTSVSSYANATYPLHGYRSAANVPSTTASSPAITTPNVAVPYGFSLANSAFATDSTPVIFGYSYSPYVNEAMPVDFGLQFSYSSSAFSFADRVVVVSGTEEWEVIDFRNNSTTTSGSPLLLARVV